MKRVLIITYYWPPSGGGGVMRWLKFVKYLPSHEWQPIIFTPENPDPSTIDESLEKEIAPEAIIIKTPIWEPYDIYRRLTGKKKEIRFKAGYISEASTRGWKDKIAVFIRGNLMIPDPRRFWVDPSVKFLDKYLRENPVDAIITTGPPHSMHLIGLGLKQKLNIPWMADFRDPWTNIDFYNKLRLTKWADRKHRRLEKSVLDHSDLVTTVSWNWASDFNKMHPRDIEVLTNGFDEEDFNFAPQERDEYFSITHIGSFNSDRNPETLWRILGEKTSTDSSFKENLKLRFVGQTDQSIFNSLENNGIIENAEDFGYVSHQKSLELLVKSQVILLPLNDTPNVLGIIPGKLFEYLASGRPIIVVGPPEGDSARIILESGAGRVAGFLDREALGQIIEEYYKAYLEGKALTSKAQIKKFSRRELTEKLVGLLEKMTK